MFKRIVTICLAVTTAVWSIGVAQVSVAAAASSGDLVKKAGSPAVYYLGEDLKLHAFTTSADFFSWYSNFDGVQTVSDSEFNSYSFGENVFVRPGSKLVQAVDGETPWNVLNGKIYAVSGDGMLHHITSASVAAELFGANWESMIVPVPVSVFTQYVEGSEISSASDYDRQGELDNSPSINAVKFNGDGGTTPVTGGNLTVSLAPDTPATILVPGNTARVPFTKVNLTATGGDVTVDSWEVIRGGVGQDGAFTGVNILTSDMLPISDNSKTFNTDHIATFTDDFMIPSGSTRSVYLVGTFGSLGSYAGETPALGLNRVVLKGNGSVSGSMPVYGNYHTLNGTITVGSATVSRGAYSNATDSTIEVGKTDFTAFSFSVLAGSTEDVWLQNIRVYQQGSASLGSDITNFRLYRDGTELAQGVVKDNRRVDFVLSTPHKIPEGQTHQFQVKVDVEDGSMRTIDFGIYRNDDLLLKGETYGFNVVPTYSGTGASGSNPRLSDNQHTISVGTLTVRRSTTVPSGNITVDSDQVLGAFEFEAKGEAVDVDSVTLSIASSASGTIEDAISSVRLVDENGVVVAGPADVTDDALTVALTDTFTVPTGKHIYKVLATLKANGGWATNDTITVSITPSSMTAEGASTDESITPSPSSAISATTQTVKAANLEVTKNTNPQDKSVIASSAGVMIGSWQFDATDSGEDIRVTALAVRASTTGDFDNLVLKHGSNEIAQAENSVDAGGNNANATTTFTFDDPLVITKGTAVSIDLYADIPSSSTAEGGEVDAWGITSSAAVTATGVNSGIAASVTVVADDGALITVQGAGTLTVNTGAIGVDGLGYFGSEGNVLTEVELTANREAIDVERLTVRIANAGVTGADTGSYQDVARFYLKRDGVIIGTQAGYPTGQANTLVTLSKGQLQVPTGSSNAVTLTIIGDLIAPNDDNKATYANDSFEVGLVGIDDATAAHFIAKGSESGTNLTASETTYNNSTGSAIVLHQSAPTVTIGDVTSKLGAGILYRVSVTANGDNVGLYRLSFETNTTDGVAISNGRLHLVSCGSCSGIGTGEVANQSSPTWWDDGGTDGESNQLWSFTMNTDRLGGGRTFIPIGEGSTATFEFRASVSGNDTGDSITTSFLSDRATSTSADDPSGQPAAAFGTAYNAGNFIWSDLHLSTANSSTGTNAKQWYNGYLVSPFGSNVTNSPEQVSHD